MTLTKRRPPVTQFGPGLLALTIRGTKIRVPSSELSVDTISIKGETLGQALLVMFAQPMPRAIATLLAEVADKRVRFTYTTVAGTRVRGRLYVTPVPGGVTTAQFAVSEARVGSRWY